MFVGTESLAKFVENLKTKTILGRFGAVKGGICNETLDEVTNCLRRGYKFEQMWMDLENTRGLWTAILPVSNHQEKIQMEMERIKRKYFPPKPLDNQMESSFMKGFKQGVELAERAIELRKMMKEVADGRK